MYRHYLPEALVRGRVNVLLVGCGGNGGRMLSGLGRMHVALNALGHPGFSVAAFDPDSVSAANIGRQLLSPSDIGRNKAEVLVTRVNFFYGLDWRAYPVKLTKDSYRESSILQTHLMITAVDRAKDRIALSNIAGPYWLDLGNMKSQGQVVFGSNVLLEQPKFKKRDLKARRFETVEKLPTILDLFPNLAKFDKDDSQGPSCSVADALNRQDLFINDWVANAALSILWTGFRKGYLTEHGMFINVDDMSVRPLSVDPELWCRMGYVVPVPEEIKKAA